VLRLRSFVQLLTKIRWSLRPSGMGAFRFVNIARKSGMVSSSRVVASERTVQLSCVGLSFREPCPAGQHLAVRHSARPLRQSPASIVPLLHDGGHLSFRQHDSASGLLAGVSAGQRAAAAACRYRQLATFYHQACGRLSGLAAATRMWATRRLRAGFGY